MSIKEQEVAIEAERRKNLIYRVTIVGSLVNLVLVFLKILAGVFGRSGAMLADGIHSLSDFVTDIIVLVFVRLSSRPKDCNHAYGHGKYETMATSFLGVVILAVGLGLFWGAIQEIRFIISGGTVEQPTIWVLYVAIISIISKEVLYRYTLRIGKRAKSSLVLANAWHHRSDAFSSIGTLLGVGGALLLGDSWVVLDPLAAAVVSLFIIRVAFQLLAPSINDLLEKALPNDIQEEILILIKSVDGVADPHNLRTRRIGNDFAIEVHIRVFPDMTVEQSHNISSNIELELRQRYGHSTHVAIHIEPLKSTKVDFSIKNLD